MTFQQINYALTIADVGSMNKAAEKLFISQPTLSSSIKELENELEITIFIRNSKGVSLTPEGSDFLSNARQVYQQYQLLKDRYVSKEDLTKTFSVSTQHYSFATKAFVETVKHYDTAKYQLAIRETKTMHVIEDVGNSRSEIGILYLSSFNRKYLSKLFDSYDVVFHHLTECNAYVYIYKGHPLAKKESISFFELLDYPCLSFEQGSVDSMYLAEEILGDSEYRRTIKTNDRATMLNLMVGLNAYTLCSGIICEELNGSDYLAIPYQADESNPNSIMEIGYLTKRHSILSDIGMEYINQLRKYLANEKNKLSDQ